MTWKPVATRFCNFWGKLSNEAKPGGASPSGSKDPPIGRAECLKSVFAQPCSALSSFWHIFLLAICRSISNR
jgi:hypothetical protein